jgi:hypothetical protein
MSQDEGLCPQHDARAYHREQIPTIVVAGRRYGPLALPPRSYYLEQISTIGACGALAGAFLLDWYHGKIGYFIKEQYFLLVLTGALLLLGLVVVRAVAVWCAAAGPQHPNRPDHERRWAPWRYVVLLLPVALSLLMPAEGRSDPGPQAIPVTLRQLEQAALFGHFRSEYEGRTVRVEGRCYSEDNEHFFLIRWAPREGRPDHHRPIRAVLIVDLSRSRERTLDARLNQKWVEVRGQVQFLKVGDGNSLVPTIVIRPTPEKKFSQLVKLVPVPANPFLD